jgi:hypothetical protein
MAGDAYLAIAFVDMRDCAGFHSRTRETLYRSLVACSELLRFCLRGELIGGVAVRDATAAIDDDPATTMAIKVGARCLALDPLSSQGIQAAIRSAIQASIVVHTILGGGDAEAAVAFYREAQRRVARQHYRTSVEVYASQTRHQSPFWRLRSDAVEKARPAVQAGSMASGAKVRLSDNALLTEMPVIEGDVIRRHATLTHPSLEQPVAWLGGVDLAPLLGMLACDRLVADVESDWSRRMAPEKAHEVLAWLLERGILVRAS